MNTAIALLFVCRKYSSVVVRHLLWLFMVLFSCSTYCQKTEDTDPEYASSVMGPTCKDLHFGGTIGFNHHGIVAGQIEYIDKSGLAFDYNLGLGSWGFKQGVSIKYYFGECGLGWQINAGVSYSGREAQGNIELTVLDSLGDKEIDAVTLHLHPVWSARFGAAHYWTLGSKMRFHLAFGYETRLTEKTYYIVSKHTLAKESKDTMEIVAPGGLTLAVGFSF